MYLVLSRHRSETQGVSPVGGSGATRSPVWGRCNDEVPPDPHDVFRRSTIHPAKVHLNSRVNNNSSPSLHLPPPPGGMLLATHSHRASRRLLVASMSVSRPSPGSTTPTPPQTNTETRTSQSASSTPRASVEKPDLAKPLSPSSEPLSSLLQDALSSSLPHDSPKTPSPSSTPRPFTPPNSVTPPPKAHHAPVNRSKRALPSHQRPRLVSRLSRSSSTTGTTYANAEDDSHTRARVHDHAHAHEPSSATINEIQRRLSSGGTPLSPGTSMWAMDYAHQHTRLESFPDLDPRTGLPKSPDMRTSDARLQIQRTISELSSHEGEVDDEPQMSLPLVGSVALPRSPFDVGRRAFSTSVSASQDFSKDISKWAKNWLPGTSVSKEHVDSILSEDDQAPTAEQEQEHINKKYETPKNPLVFCHGLLGFDVLGPRNIAPMQISYWRGVREVLESNGAEVMICRVPATASIKDRATILMEQIEKQYEGRTVNLIGHSMGGLDCRYLISVLKPTKFSVCSLTTISTPHRGSPFADYVIDNVIGRDRLPQLLGMMESLNLPNSGDGSAFAALGTRAMRVFNTEVIDDPNVHYYSWGASCDPGLLDTFRWPHNVIYAKEGPNDGLVSVYSARWGEYRGTLLGVNHLEMVGWVNAMKNMFSNLTGNPVSFKPGTFYLEIVSC